MREIEDNPRLGFREGIDVWGRPDFGGTGWGVRLAKRHLPYVHSTTRHATLIHKVACVRIRWYQGHYAYMRRLDKPVVIAETVCGMSKFVQADTKHPAKMCKIPDPQAVLCGKCHGELATFSKHRVNRIKKQWARDHLGCTGTTEVIGPYVPPEAA